MLGGVSNVDMDENNTLEIKAIRGAISTFETLPSIYRSAKQGTCRKLHDPVLLGGEVDQPWHLIYPVGHLRRCDVHADARHSCVREEHMAVKASREFQIFAKPVGAICNLDCHYCYYLQKELLYPQTESFRMPDDLLEEYIVQQIAIAPEPVINFFWHGGEPTILGLDYFRKIVALQRQHQPPGRHISNGIQTNGVLLNEDWCRFFATEEFAVGLSLDVPQAFYVA
jgi:hypothetical protein